MVIVKSSFNEFRKNVKMDLTETEQKYAHAALAVFQRYGVRKATMEEIAAEAGVSKPTLYATIRNKDAALGVAIRFAKGAAIEAVKEAWANANDLPEKMDIFFDQLVLAGFDMLHAAPDAAAFETALGDASRDAIAATQQADVDAMTQVFEETDGLEKIDISHEEFASFFVSSAMNAKRQAQSREELERYLKILKALSLNATQC